MKTAKEIIILVGPPGSGKSTFAEKLKSSHLRISQDAAGKEGHMRYFLQGLADGQSMVIDRMNFNKEQRKRYLEPAKANGYQTKIIVLHENKETCMTRMLARTGHETIKDEENAKAALHTFFRFYERPQESEADEIEFRYPEGPKPQCVTLDLDGTLFNIDHRLHHVQSPGKKNWPAFFDGIKDDTLNPWCHKLLMLANLDADLKIVLASGRGEEYREATEKSLRDNALSLDYDHLFMREAKDSRSDTVIKENILDFEILTRFTPIFFVDDRPSVCRMWRSRGFDCLQIQEKEF